jgi:hypothetical protein
VGGEGRPLERVADRRRAIDANKAAGEVLTANQAPHRPGTAPALGLKCWQRRSGESRRKARARFRPRLEVLEGRLTPAVRLAPAVLTVNTAADETAADNALSLREAIGVVNSQSEAGLSPAERAQISGTLGSNDTIVFASSLNGQTIKLTNGELLINKDLTIAGPGAGQLTVSGGGVSRDFEVDSAQSTIKVVLSGLTISNGNAFGGWGGGVYNGGENLTLSGCTLSGNSAMAGGAIFNYFGTVTVSGCTLSDNHADLEGGGIANDRGTMTVSNCTISGNTASDPGNAGPGGIGEGGGIYDIPIVDKKGGRRHRQRLHPVR